MVGGAKAFQRLQEEILRQSDDETIFAWDYGPDATADSHSGLLTPHLYAFRNCQYLKATTLRRRVRAPLSTNRGIELECWVGMSINVDPERRTPKKLSQVAFLDASFHRPGESERFVGIFLLSLDQSAESYMRVTRVCEGKLPHRWEGHFEGQFQEYTERSSFSQFQTVLVKAGPEICYQPWPSVSISLGSLLTTSNTTAMYSAEPSGRSFVEPEVRRVVVPKSCENCFTSEWAGNNESQLFTMLHPTPDWSHGALCNIFCHGLPDRIVLVHLGFTAQLKPICIILDQRRLIPADSDTDDVGEVERHEADSQKLKNCAMGRKILAFEQDYSDVPWTPFEELIFRGWAEAPRSRKPARRSVVERRRSEIIMGPKQPHRAYCAIQHQKPQHGKLFVCYHFQDTGESPKQQSHTDWSIVLQNHRVGLKLCWRISFYRWEEPKVLFEPYMSEMLKIQVASKLKRMINDLSLTICFHFWAASAK